MNIFIIYHLSIKNILRVNDSLSFSHEGHLFVCFFDIFKLITILRYEITRSLGHGAFADVVQAIDHKTGLDVALKISVRDCEYARHAGASILDTLHIRISRWCSISS